MLYARPNSQPNVIVIYTDDQGFGDASCLNSESKFQTPNIDRLAREGMTFTDGHCSDTVCTPSRYGLLTGRYSWRTELKKGVFGAERKCLIEDGRMTLASLLRDNGYSTAMVGKWHLGMDFPGTNAKDRDWSQPVRDMPLDKGFDYFWGIPASMNYGVLAWFEGRHAAVPPTLFTRKKPNAIAISDYRIMPPYEDAAMKPNDLETAPDFVDSECLTRFTDRAIDWVQSKAQAARGGNPFFLYLPYTSPHKPVIPVDRFKGKSEAGAYGDFMLETDWHIGRLLQLLDDEHLAENTLVFFSSDNGPENTFSKRIELFEHHSSGVYRDGKRSIYEGGHRVPFIVRWPTRVKAGSRCDVPVCQTDLLATLAEINTTELPGNAGEDSTSFLSSLLGQTHHRPAVIHHASNGRFAVRDGRWKLVMQWRKKSQELYDLEADPAEKNDVRSNHPDVAARLQQTITEIVRNGRSSPGVSQRNDAEWWSDLAWMKP
ncbi:MAG: arylsulfatase [Fuerstiella sp.]|nr:arylsulfatase [Fuerstiella sp.]